MTRHIRAVSRNRLVSLTIALAALWACQENLPVGPETFTVSMSVSTWTDTVVIGDTKSATVRTMDSQNREIQGLRYSFAFADTTIARFAQDTARTNASTVTALKAGVTTATISLDDSRFVVPPLTRSLRVVVGGVAVSTSHDTTLTAINDTARVIAASLVMTGGSPTYRPGQGVKWTRRGPGAVTVVGTGDTIRVIAKAAGTDTLIVSHDFCVAGARCADTVYARVQQSLKLALTAKAFTAWTFGDTAGLGITLADRRGTGNALASIRLVPVTAADSGRVTLTATLGTTNATTGAMAAPRMISAGNGTARVAVVGRNPDGSTADSDTITFTIRQIAVRASVEPLAMEMTEVDTLPVRAVARDVRGFAISDATLSTTVSAGLALTGSALTVTSSGATFVGTLFTSVSGIALAASNPGAPAVTLSADTATVSVIPAVTYSADAVSRTQNIALVLRAPGGGPLSNRWVRWIASSGVLSADSTRSDGTGAIAITWTPTSAARRHVLTGLLRPVGVETMGTDSAGFVVIRRSVTVAPGVPVPGTSTMTIRTAVFRAGDTASVTVRVRDAAANLVTSTVPADITILQSGGTLSAITCDGGICTALYTATTIPAGSINAQIGGIDVGGSPVALAITPGVPAAMVFATAPGDPAAHNGLITGPPVIRIVDLYGNTCTTEVFTVEASVNAQIAGAVTSLTGTTTVSSVAGVVTYAGLGLSGAATGTVTLKFAVTAGPSILPDLISGNVVNPP